jgi:formate dehydrogenase major subunit
MTNSIDELESMGSGDVIFAVGTNTTECHPVIGANMLQAVRQGARLVVADPRAVTLAAHAAVWLRLRPGTDVALLNGIAHVIIAEGLADEAFIAQRTEGYAAFRETVLRCTPQKASAITGVPADDIRSAARILGCAANVSTYYTMGITQHTSGVDNVRAVANIALLTGNAGRPGTGVNPLRGQNNVQGACDMGALPDVLPAYQRVTDPAVRERFAAAWGREVPGKPGLRIPDVLHGLEHGTVRALYVFGENPMRSDPDVGHVEHCLDAAEFLVVQDIFLTETAAKAYVVLPGASFAEKDGTFSSTERRVQRIRRAVPPAGGSRPDWQILSELLTRMGAGPEYGSPEEIFDKMRALTPSYAGITYARLEKGGLQWPCPDVDHPGTPVLHRNAFMRGRGAFLAVEHREPAELPDDAYPLMLTTGRVVAHYHTGTMTRRCWGLNGVAPEEQVELHPDDAAPLGIADGDMVRLTSRRGSMTARVHVTEKTMRGLVFVTFHYSESCGNVLTNSAADPETGTAELKICSVRVEKADRQGPCPADTAGRRPVAAAQKHYSEPAVHPAGTPEKICNPS